MLTLLINVVNNVMFKLCSSELLNCYFYYTPTIASHYENVVIELLKAKCLPSPYYGLDACPINKSQIKSLDFVLNSVFRKIFLIKSYDVASECITFFDCSVSDAIYKRKLKFTF